MKTHIDVLKKHLRLGWISALRSGSIRRLLAAAVGSQTAVLGQKLVRVVNVTALQQYETLDASTNIPNALAALQACQTDWSNPSAGGSPDNQRGDNWAHGAMDVTMFNTIAPPNAYNSSLAYYSRVGSGARSDLSNSDSWHPVGVKVTMANGSVRFIKNSINIQTWMALGTRANGEVVSSDSY